MQEPAETTMAATPSTREIVRYQTGAARKEEQAAGPQHPVAIEAAACAAVRAGHRLALACLHAGRQSSFHKRRVAMRE